MQFRKIVVEELSSVFYPLLPNQIVKNKSEHSGCFAPSQNVKHAIANLLKKNLNTASD